MLDWAEWRIDSSWWNRKLAGQTNSWAGQSTLDSIKHFFHLDGTPFKNKKTHFYFLNTMYTWKENMFSLDVAFQIVYLRICRYYKNQATKAFSLPTVQEPLLMVELALKRQTWLKDDVPDFWELMEIWHFILLWKTFTWAKTELSISFHNTGTVQAVWTEKTSTFSHTSN